MYLLVSRRKIKFIDLFAGLGGTRLGLEQALKKLRFEGMCVFTSEIKPHAIEAYKKNFPNEKVHGDITKIDASEIPNFDILLAGFPCQPFSSAGVRRGFMDTRGTLFFDIERILKFKKPSGFILENVEGLVTHDRVDPKKDIGRTLETIINRLSSLGYKVSWKVIDASLYGVPQKRRRIYIVGSKRSETDIDSLPVIKSSLADILETRPAENLYINSEFTHKLLNYYTLDDLKGRQIKDKRGGRNNIHSWDFELKGSVSNEQKLLLSEMLKQRRRKGWATLKGIPWSDGMPLTLDEILSFHQQTLFESGMPEKKYKSELRDMLDDLVQKKYIAYEYPKKAPPGSVEKGYNIITGKLSFEISHILDPASVTPTLVATDVTRLAIADKKGLRRLSTREGLRLFGFPESYTIDNVVSYREAFDLLGNSVSVNVIELLSERLLKVIVK